MKSHLVDVNVWLALVYDGHPHHRVARAWHEALADRSAFFCRVTQLGLLRLLTHSSVMKEDTLSQRQAWKVYDVLRADPTSAFLHEAAPIEPELRRLTSRRTASPKLWTDCYLASLAMSAGLSIVTFDKGFSALQIEAEILALR